MTTLLEMKQKKAKEYAAILLAFCDGKTIEANRLNLTSAQEWVVVKYPNWNFDMFEYRVREEANEKA